jgi:FkbH-like protein
MDDYLRSLQLTLTIFCDSKTNVPRVAQLTQKTNQFNLTTKRYTEAEIQSFLASPRWSVYAFSLADMFGDFGLTGVALVTFDPSRAAAEIDTLLLSCRVLGRNVEFAFFDYVVDQLHARGVRNLRASYFLTKKNAQVESLYDSRGFKLLKQEDGGKTYSLDVEDYRPAKIDYIQVQVGG